MPHPIIFFQLAHTECSGATRTKKTVAVINRMTIKNKLMPYIAEHKEDVLNMLRNKSDRQLLFVAMMCSAYTPLYDTMAQMSKYFHVQDEVTREYLLKKLSEKYGSNRMLDVAFDCVMPMLIEAGFIVRAKPGVYQMVKQDKFTDEALMIYRQSFLLNNPNFTETDYVDGNSYFEFLKQ
jgi:translation initiation factor RLI1